MASSPFQREASHHVGGTPGNHCPRTESRTEGLLSAGLEPGRVAIPHLKAEDIDWRERVISFCRKKTGTVSLIRFGDEVAEILHARPTSGPLFPYLCSVRAGDRATEFKQRCDGLQIKGVSLHSYRYSWAERAKTVGYPERFAQEALGHNSKAVHRAYARKAKVTLPSLEDYEKHPADQKVIQMQVQHGATGAASDAARSVKVTRS